MPNKQSDKHPYYTINFFLGVKLLFAHKIYRTRYFFKFILILLFSLLLMPFQLFNKLFFRVRLGNYQLPHDPIFIIGHWRSGTSLLHHLLACDPQWGIVSGFYAFFPDLETFDFKIIRNLIKKVMIEKRPQDNMPRSIDVPEEEEFALSNISKYGVYHSLWLPKEDDYFNEFGLFNTTQTKIENWKKKYLSLVKKYAYLNNSKRLLLKNPVNTARIKVLLELFPNAKFIYIHRDAVETYCSMLKMYETAIKPQFLQNFDNKQIKTKTANWYVQIRNCYEEQSKLIAKPNLIEVRFEDLIKNPLQLIDLIYAELRIEKSTDANKRMISYLDSVKSYQQNHYRLGEKDRNEILKLIQDSSTTCI